LVVSETVSKTMSKNMSVATIHQNIERSDGMAEMGRTGRRNTPAKSHRRGLDVQRFPRPLVELALDLVEIGLRVWRQVRPARKVLAQQPVGVLVRSALPGALRVAEIDGNVSFRGEALVVGEFFSAIPRQRFLEFAGYICCGQVRTETADGTGRDCMRDPKTRLPAGADRRKGFDVARPVLTAGRL
jgi:hypothetical protein